jgi:tetratricopeptide (TPR) repeat protein
MKTYRLFVSAWICGSALTWGEGKQLGQSDPLPDVPEGAQAVSLLGDPLYPPDPNESALANYEEAKKAYETSPDDPDRIIWYGRRAGYLGRYREAILIFTEGTEKHPQDARFFRHRGHRYISIREFDRAIRDLEHAVTLTRNQEDQIEPDGQPNAKNIPLTTLQRNIWYHLGLAYFLKGDPENARRAYRQCLGAGKYDDNYVSTAFWLYITLRRLGKLGEARKVLEPVHRDMDLIENGDYLRLCLLYKGEVDPEEIIPSVSSSVDNLTFAYGAVNWFFHKAENEDADALLEKILKNKSWGAFAYIAAEADYSRRLRKASPNELSG